MKPLQKTFRLFWQIRKRTVLSVSDPLKVEGGLIKDKEGGSKGGNLKGKLGGISTFGGFAPPSPLGFPL